MALSIGGSFLSRSEPSAIVEKLLVEGQRFGKKDYKDGVALDREGKHEETVQITLCFCDTRWNLARVVKRCGTCIWT
jgi:hypothetical protein